MATTWTRDAILQVIKRDLLLDRLDLQSNGITLEAIKDDTPLLDGGLSIDSVDALDLLVGAEKAFGIEMPDMTDAFIKATCASVASLADYIHDRLLAGNAAPA